MALLDCVSKLELGAEVGRCVVSKYFGSNGGIRKQCSIFVSILREVARATSPGTRSITTLELVLLLRAYRT